MSIFIPECYIIPLEHFNEFLKLSEDFAFERAKKKILQVKKDKECGDDIDALRECLDKVIAERKESWYCTPFDFAWRIYIIPQHQKALLIPICSDNDIISKMDNVPDYVKHYSYWSTLDKPINIDDDAWNMMGQVWAWVLENCVRVTYDIIPGLEDAKSILWHMRNLGEIE